jgi:hypothetical protein
MNKKDAAIAAIRTCRTREELTDMLKRFEIKGERETIDCLNECMYSPEVFFASKPDNIADELEFTIQIFLTGKWRLNIYYERMGIPSNAEVAVDG